MNKSIDITFVRYTDTNGWSDDPVYFVAGQKSLNANETVNVFTLEDKVMIGGIWGKEQVQDETNELVDYLRSIPFEERLEKIKNLERSIKGKGKYKL